VYVWVCIRNYVFTEPFKKTKVERHKERKSLHVTSFLFPGKTDLILIS